MQYVTLNNGIKISMIGYCHACYTCRGYAECVDGAKEMGIITVWEHTKKQNQGQDCHDRSL